MKELIVANNSVEELEQFDISGNIGCYIACVGGCLITQMVAAAMAVVTMDLS